MRGNLLKGHMSVFLSFLSVYAYAIIALVIRKFYKWKYFDHSLYYRYWFVFFFQFFLSATHTHAYVYLPKVCKGSNYFPPKQFYFTDNNNNNSKNDDDDDDDVHLAAQTTAKKKMVKYKKKLLYVYTMTKSIGKVPFFMMILYKMKWKKKKSLCSIPFSKCVRIHATCVGWGKII